MSETFTATLRAEEARRLADRAPGERFIFLSRMGEFGSPVGGSVLEFMRVILPEELQAEVITGIPIVRLVDGRMFLGSPDAPTVKIG